MMIDNYSSKTAMIFAVGIGVTVAVSGYYYLKRIFQQNLSIPPSNWKLVGTIQEILIFPIKSCAAISLSTAECDVIGIKSGKCKDRQFMLIDQNGKVVTSRTYPKMLKIQPEIINGELIVSAPGMDTLKINYKKFTNNNGNDIKAEIWNQDVFVTSGSAYYDKWFSQYLMDCDQGLRFVYYPFPIATKSIVTELRNAVFLKEDTGSLQDVSSYMLINNDSVDDLNTKLERKVSNLNFRGNFAVKTFNGEAYAEDNWKWIKIGEASIFQKLTPCYRCISPNIDPVEAKFYPNCQPLKTLKTYRVFGDCKDPQMGIQLGIRATGIVNIGDEVYADDING